MAPANKPPGRFTCFVFTINSGAFETEESTTAEGGRIFNNVRKIEELYESGEVTYAIGSYEIGEETQRFHLQGYLQLEPKVRQTEAWLARRLEDAWVGGSVKTNAIKAKLYAMGYSKESDYKERKDGYVRHAFEFGTWAGSARGKRTDLESVRDGILSGELVTQDDVVDSFPSVAAHSEHYVRMLLRRRAREARETDLMDGLSGFQPRVWQYWLCKYLNELEPDNRTIIFVVDKNGGAGKSTFCDWYDVCAGVRPSHYMRPTKKADMAEMYDPACSVLFLDVPRHNEFLSHLYVFCEEVKDGRVVCPKYHSAMVKNKPPHVVVYMNVDVDIGGKLMIPPGGNRGYEAGDVEYQHTLPALTFDRYRIWNLDFEHCETWKPGCQYDASPPPFEVFEDPAMTPGLYTPPLVVNSGPEFNGDQAGDGPRCETPVQSFASVTPYDRWNDMVEYTTTGRVSRPGAEVIPPREPMEVIDPAATWRLPNDRAFSSYQRYEDEMYSGYGGIFHKLHKLKFAKTLKAIRDRK